jgi:hypothetical protein
MALEDVLVKKDGESLERFFAKDGQGFVETNGTPAVANGKVYFGTRDELYCIGKKAAAPAGGAPPPDVAHLFLATFAVQPAGQPNVQPAHVQVLPADVDALVGGCLNVLGTLKMIDRVVKPVAKPVWVTAGSRVQAERSGMFFATAARDSMVKAGDVLGFQTDYLGRRVGDVKAPVAGLVTFIRGVPSMWVGATLANVSPVLPEPPPYKKP